MDADRFWSLLEDPTPPGPERTERLTVALAALGPEEIAGFQQALLTARHNGGTDALRAAAYRICDGLWPRGGFAGFQNWLLSQGREMAEEAAADPDTLAELPQLRALALVPAEQWQPGEWPEWPELDGVAAEAYSLATGERGPLLTSATVAAGGDRWDEELLAEHPTPALTKLFPATGPERRQERGAAIFARLLAERGQSPEEFLADPY